MTSLSEKSINNSLTRANSAEIVDFCIPDYETRYQGTFTQQTVESPADGLFIYEVLGLGSGGSRTITVNNQNVAYIYNSSSNYGGTFIFPVRKGDIIKTSATPPIGESWALYPYKGV